MNRSLLTQNAIVCFVNFANFVSLRNFETNRQKISTCDDGDDECTLPRHLEIATRLDLELNRGLLETLLFRLCHNRQHMKNHPKIGRMLFYGLIYQTYLPYLPYLRETVCDDGDDGLSFLRLHHHYFLNQKFLHTCGLIQNLHHYLTQHYFQFFRQLHHRLENKLCRRIQGLLLFARLLQLRAFRQRLVGDSCVTSYDFDHRNYPDCHDSCYHYCYSRYICHHYLYQD